MAKRQTLHGSRLVIDAGGIRTRICPATNNLPTRMSAKSWKELCRQTAQKQEGRSMNGWNLKSDQVRKRLNFCQECKGKILPPGLELIAIADLVAIKKPKEETMSTNPGACACCGQKKSVSRCKGELLCSGCASMAGAVSNRLESVVEMVIKRDRAADMLAGLVAVQGQSWLMEEVQRYLPEQVAVQVESATLKEIAEVIGYDGESSEGLVEAVREMATAGSSQSESTDALQRIILALGCECEDGSDSVTCVLESIGMLTQTLDKINQHDKTLQAALNNELAERDAFVTDIEHLRAENSRLAALVEDQADALAVALSGDEIVCHGESIYTMQPEREALADFGLRVLAGRVRLEVM